MTVSRFYLLDVFRSKSTPVHFYRGRLSVSQDICRSVVPSLSKAVQCFAKPCSVSKKANTRKQAASEARTWSKTLLCPPSNRSGRGGTTQLCLLEKAKRLHATRAFTQPVPWSLPFLCVFCLRRPAPERRRG